jgi:hypothetical protein
MENAEVATQDEIHLQFKNPMIRHISAEKHAVIGILESRIPDYQIHCNLTMEEPTVYYWILPAINVICKAILLMAYQSPKY